MVIYTHADKSIKNNCQWIGMSTPKLHVVNGSLTVQEIRSA